MTSNLGSQLIREEIEKKGGALNDNEMYSLQQTVFNMLKQTIRPEFLNRIDDTIMFMPLNKQEIAQVVSLQINAVKEMLRPQGFTLEVTPHAIDYLADAGFDPEFGARPVKRAIQNLLLNDLSKKLLAGEVNRDNPIKIDSFGDGLVFINS
jgi:ATP-dependent Clp protease ATP-binding subunit ClpB